MRLAGTKNVSNFHYKVTYNGVTKYFKTQSEVIKYYKVSRHAIHHGINPNLSQFRIYKDYEFERIHQPIYKKVLVDY